MKAKKILSGILTLCTMLTLLVSCSGNVVIPNPNTNETTNTQTETRGEPTNDPSTEDFTAETQEKNSAETPIINNPKYNIDSIDPFYYGLARISTDQGYGYIDTTGKIVIEPIYDSASTQFNVLSIVVKDEVKQYINKNSQAVYTFNGKETNYGAYKNGFFWIETSKESISGTVYTITYYNELGEVAFSLDNAKAASYEFSYHNLNAWNKQTKYMSSFNQWGYAVVKINNVGKFIDTKGNIITFDGMYSAYDIKMLQDNYIVTDDYVENKNVYYVDYSNKSANAISKYSSTSIYELQIEALGNEYYSNYFRYTYEKKHQSITKNNEQLLFSSIPELGNAIVRGVSSFVNNDQTNFILYVESTSGVFWSTIIDFDGNILMPLTNELHLGYQSYSASSGYNSAYRDYSCYNFSSGLIKAKDEQTQSYGYVDPTGAWIISPKFSSASNFYGEGENAVAVVNNNTIIDRNGNIIFSAAK